MPAQSPPPALSPPPPACAHHPEIALRCAVRRAAFVLPVARGIEIEAVPECKMLPPQAQALAQRARTSTSRAATNAAKHPENGRWPARDEAQKRTYCEPRTNSVH